MFKSKENVLEGRSQSGFPLSVGTGLALETLFDPINEVVDDSRQVDKIPDLSRYDTYIINIGTLIRNIISSVPGEDIMKIRSGMLYETLVEEIGFLSWFFSENSLRVEFYDNSYSYYKNAYKDRMRTSSTERQYHIERITNKCSSLIKNKNKEVTQFSHMVNYKDTRNALMLTHVPADLLAHSKYTILDLLESNTGRIKSRKEFNSKYHPIPRQDMSRLPFFEYLLVIFGDSVMFKPHPIAKRNEVYEVLMNNPKVHPLMSEFSLSLFV